MHHHRITTPRRKGTWDSVEFLDRTGPGAGMIGEGGESILEIKNDNLYLAVGAVRRKPVFREDPGRSGMFWDGGRIPASYYLLYLDAKSWGKTR